MTLIDRKGQVGPPHPIPSDTTTNAAASDEEQPPPYAGPAAPSNTSNSTMQQREEEPHRSDETTPLLASSQRGDVENQQDASSSPRKFSKRIRRSFRWVASGVVVVLIIFLLGGAVWSHGSDRDDDGGDGHHGDAKRPNPIDYPGPPPIGTPTWSPVQRHADWSDPFESHTSLTLDPSVASLFVENLGHRHGGRVDVLLQQEPVVGVKARARGNDQQVLVSIEARANKEWILKKALSVAKRKEGSQEGVGIYSEDRFFENNDNRLAVYVNVTLPLLRPSSTRGGGDSSFGHYGDFDIRSDVASIATHDLGKALTFQAVKIQSQVGSVTLHDTTRAGSINVTSEVGSVKATGLAAVTQSLYAHSQLGALKFATIESPQVDLRSGVGSIHAETILSPLTTLKSDAGQIEVGRIEANQLAASTGAGSIKMGAVPIEDRGKDALVELHSEMGSVHLDLLEKTAPGSGKSLAHISHSRVKSASGSAMVQHWPSFIGRYEFSSKLGSLTTDWPEEKNAGGRDRIFKRTDNGYWNKLEEGCVFMKDVKGGSEKWCDAEQPYNTSVVFSNLGSVRAAF